MSSKGFCLFCALRASRCLAIRTSYVTHVLWSFTVMNAVELGCTTLSAVRVFMPTPLRPGHPKPATGAFSYSVDAIALRVPHTGAAGSRKRFYSGQRCYPLGASHSPYQLAYPRLERLWHGPSSARRRNVSGAHNDFGGRSLGTPPQDRPAIAARGTLPAQALRHGSGPVCEPKRRKALGQDPGRHEANPETARSGESSRRTLRGFRGAIVESREVV